MFKLNRTLLLIGALIVFYLAAFVHGCMYGKNGVKCPDAPAAAPPATIIKRDTATQVLPRDTTNEIHQPTLAREVKPAVKKPAPAAASTPVWYFLHDLTLDSFRVGDDRWVPASLYQALLVRFDSLQDDYRTARYYTDTARFPGRANVIVTNWAQQNRISGQRIQLDSLQTTTVTNTVTQYAKKRNQVWVGLNSGYRVQDTTLMVGPELQFIHKRGIGFKTGVFWDTRGNRTHTAGINYLIKVKKS